MTDYPRHDNTESAPRHGGSQTTMWSGWIWFAAIVMVLTGMFNAIEGLVALFNRTFYITNGEDLILLDLTTWGWVHLLLGTLVGLSGFALLFAAPWARVTGVVVASINAVAQLAFISAYPVWSTIVIALSVLVIWAIVVHGRDVTNDVS